MLKGNFCLCQHRVFTAKPLARSAMSCLNRQGFQLRRFKWVQHALVLKACGHGTRVGVGSSQRGMVLETGHVPSLSLLHVSPYGWPSPTLWPPQVPELTRATSQMSALCLPRGATPRSRDGGPRTLRDIDVLGQGGHRSWSTVSSATCSSEKG